MADPKPIQDVAHPNKSAPSGNSKSVIVTHRARVQDPMVNTQVNTAEPESSPVPSHNSDKSTIQPMTAPTLTPVDKPEPIAEEAAPEPANETVETTTPEAANHVSLELKPLPASQSVEKPAEPETPETSEVNEAEASGKKDPTQMNQDQVDQEKLKAEAALQKLVDSKQYFLPINTLESRRSKRFITLGVLLSIILIAAWTDIALDAHLITIDGLKPLTNFFST